MIKLPLGPIIIIVLAAVTALSPPIIGGVDGLLLAAVSFAWMTTLALLLGAIDIGLLMYNAMTLGDLGFTRKTYRIFRWTLLGLVPAYITGHYYLDLCFVVTNSTVFETLIQMICYPLAIVICAYGALLTTSLICLEPVKEEAGV